MTPRARRALERLRRQAARLEPALVASLLRALKLARDQVSEAELARLVAAGRIAEAVDAAVPVAVLERLLNPASALLRQDVVAGIRSAAGTMPTSVQQVVVGFNELSPRIVDAVRALDTTSLRSLVPEVRQAVREIVERGLVDGAGPRTVARTIRETIGLAPNQAEAVRNYRRALEAGDLARARGYRLADARFSLTDLTPERIDRMVAAYEARMRTFNAETHARTAAIESQKLGQQLAWQEAQLSGALDGASVIATWVTTLDGRERPEHHAMHGQTRPLDGTYANGQRYPGEGEYNCRCTEVFAVVRAAQAA